MAKFQSPLLGYNNNVRHKNRVFHIQTEDSGVKHPHVITHLFMDGGRILKSVKTSYAEHVGADDLQATVKQMMKDQHKAMFIALRDGQFDHLVDPGGEAPTARSAPVPKKASSRPPKKKTLPPPPVVLTHPPDASLTPVAAQAEQVPPASRPGARNPALFATQTIPAPPPSDALPDSGAMRPPMATLPEDIPHVPEHALPPPRLEPRIDSPSLGLPPTPAPLLRPKKAESGRYSQVSAELAEQLTQQKVPTTAKLPEREPEPVPARPAVAAAAAAAASPEGRYAPARPAAIFGKAKPRQSSIFGEDLISDKSLDEVILSYLAEDLETDKK